MGGVDLWLWASMVLVLVLVPAQGPNQETAGSTALTWLAMCCGHEGSYRFDRTVAYVSRSRDTSWGTLVRTEAVEDEKGHNIILSMD